LAKHGSFLDATACRHADQNCEHAKEFMRDEATFFFARAFRGAHFVRPFVLCPLLLDALHRPITESQKKQAPMFLSLCMNLILTSRRNSTSKLEMRFVILQLQSPKLVEPKCRHKEHLLSRILKLHFGVAVGPNRCMGSLLTRFGPKLVLRMARLGVVS